MPNGLDKENIPEEQREFLFFLLGNTPSIETVNRIVDYETKLNDIERKNWKRRAIKEYGRNQLEILAKLEKISFEDYVEKLAKENKEIEIKALNELYGITKNKENKKSKKEEIEEHFKKNKEIIEQEKLNSEKTKEKENLLFLSKKEIINKLKEKK